MTNPLAARLRKFAEFDEAHVTNEWTDAVMEYKVGTGNEILPVKMARNENARLAPLIAGLIECVEYLEKAGHTHWSPDSTSDEYVYGYEQAMSDIQEWASEPLARIKKLCGEIKE